MVVIIAASFLTAGLSGKIYDFYVLESGGFFNPDPNFLLSGFLMSLCFTSSFFAGLRKNIGYAVPAILIILFDVALDVRYDLRFDLIATALGLVIGYTVRQVLGVHTKEITGRSSKQ